MIKGSSKDSRTRVRTTSIVTDSCVAYLVTPRTEAMDLVEADIASCTWTVEDEASLQRLLS